MYYAGRYPVQTRRGRLSQSTCLVRCLPLITTIGGYLICSGAVCWSSRRFHVSAVDLAQGTSVLSQGTVTELLSFSLRIINHDSNKHGFRSISYSNRPFCRRCGGCCRPRLPPPRARSRVSYRRRRSCRGTLCCAVSTRSDNVTPVPRAPEWMSIRWSLAFQADCAFSTAFLGRCVAACIRSWSNDAAAAYSAGSSFLGWLVWYSTARTARRIPPSASLATDHSGLPACSSGRAAGLK